MAKKDIGTILKEARQKRNLSQADLAKILKLKSAQSISDWERNYGSGVPAGTLKRLIRLYDLNLSEVFDALLEFQQMKVREKLESEFFGKRKSR